MNCLEDFLQQIQSCTSIDSKLQSQRLLQLLRSHPESNHFVVKINNLGNLSDTQISQLVERRNWYNGDWLAFDQLVVSFVKLCNQMNPWSSLESFDLYATYLNDITVAFMHKRKGHLVTILLEDAINQIVPMANRLDCQMLQLEMHNRPRLTFMTSILLKVFNNIRSQLGADDHIEAMKKSIMLFIGVKLCQSYFSLSNPLLCQNVFSNMNNANLHFSAYPPNQQLQYRYYLAKFYIAKYEFVDAFEHLHWCLGHIPINYSTDCPNVTVILRDFLPISILLGKRPNISIFSRLFYSSPIKCPSFFSLYAELASAIQAGNFSALHDLINDAENSKFLKDNDLASIFASKTYLITLRNLVRRIWVAQGKKVRLEYDSLRRCLLLSLNGLELTSVTTLSAKPSLRNSTDQTLSDHVVENCLVSLIDQNFLRGKVFPRLRVVSLAKSEVFPEIPATYFSKFGNGSEGLLNISDRWIGHS